MLRDNQGQGAVAVANKPYPWQSPCSIAIITEEIYLLSAGTDRFDGKRLVTAPSNVFTRDVTRLSVCRCPQCGNGPIGCVPQACADLYVPDGRPSSTGCINRIDRDQTEAKSRAQ